MTTSEATDVNLSGGTLGAQGDVIIRFEDTAGLYAATKFSYSDLQRAEIISSLEKVTGTVLPEHRQKLFFYQLGSIGVWGLNTILQIPELEDERDRKAAQVEALRGAVGVCDAMPKDPNLVAALPRLQMAIDEFSESVAKLWQRIDHLRSRYPGAGNNRWFAQIVQVHAAEALEGQGGAVSGSKAFVAYHDAVLRPVLENASVRSITGCMWTEGMARTFSAKYREGNGRRR